MDALSIVSCRRFATQTSNVAVMQSLNGRGNCLSFTTVSRYDSLQRNVMTSWLFLHNGWMNCSRGPAAVSHRASCRSLGMQVYIVVPSTKNTGRCFFVLIQLIQLIPHWVLSFSIDPLAWKVPWALWALLWAQPKKWTVADQIKRPFTHKPQETDCSLCHDQEAILACHAASSTSAVAMWQFGCQNGIFYGKWQRFLIGMTRGTGARLHLTSQPHVLVPVEAPAVCTPGGWRPETWEMSGEVGLGSGLKLLPGKNT